MADSTSDIVLARGAGFRGAARQPRYLCTPGRTRFFGGLFHKWQFPGNGALNRAERPLPLPEIGASAEKRRIS